MKQKCYLAIYANHFRRDEKILTKPITKEVLSVIDGGVEDYIDDVPGPVPCCVDTAFAAGFFYNEEDLVGAFAIHIEFEKEENEIIYGDENKDPLDCAVQQILPEEITRIGKGHYARSTPDEQEEYYINWSKLSEYLEHKEYLSELDND